MSSYEYTSAPRAVNVLPTRASRRLTRRDGLLPFVFALELLAGVAFGLASHSGSSDATSVPAKLTVGSAPLVTVQPSLQPMASVTASTSVALPTAGPAVPAAQVPMGPAVGPLLPGTVRGVLPVVVAPVVVVPVAVAPDAVAPASPTDVVVASATPYPTHSPRDPFAALAAAKP